MIYFTFTLRATSSDLDDRSNNSDITVVSLLCIIWGCTCFIFGYWPSGRLPVDTTYLLVF